MRKFFKKIKHFVFWFPFLLGLGILLAFDDLRSKFKKVKVTVGMGEDFLPGGKYHKPPVPKGKRNPWSW